MRHFSEVYGVLRRKNKSRYALLAGCSFFSVLLITAYSCMMRSPTILSVLPEGGDSRKQVMMVFVLAVVGCAVFTAYAAGLFFRPAGLGRVADIPAVSGGFPGNGPDL